jgi:hypothetical protein
MSDPQSGACKRCHKVLCSEDFARDRAMMLLGRAYCATCLEIMTPTCHLCRKALHEGDFAEGRAVTLQGVRFCDACMEQAVRTTQPSTTAPVEKPQPEWKTRRSAIRFVPPLDCEVTLKPAGLKGLLSANIVRLWVDVSEGGIRAIVQGTFEAGDVLQGKLTHPELEDKLEFQGVVRHGRPSDKFPGCTLIGLRFEEPSKLFQAFIRDVLGREQGVLPLSPPTPKPRPPSAQSA